MGGIFQDIHAKYELEPSVSSTPLPRLNDAGCVPVRAGLNTAVKRGDTVTFMLLSKKPYETYISTYEIGEPGEALDFCLPLKLLETMVDRTIHLACLLESSGTVISAEPKQYVII